jgi:O-antigen/teichoic acid export membrane protein
MSVDSLTARPRAAAIRGVFSVGLVRDTLGTLGLNLSTTVLNFLLTLALARALGARDYGAYAFAIAWASVLSIPAMLGLTPLVIRHVATYTTREAWPLLRGLLRRTNQVVLASSAVVLAVGAAVGWIGNRSNEALLHPFLVALLLVPLISLTTVRQAAMQGLGRVVLGRLPETLIAPALFLTLVGVIWLVASDRLSATAVVALNVSAVCVAFLTGAVLLRRSLPVESRRAVPAFETRAWARAGIPLLAFSVLMAFNNQVGTILLGWMRGPADAGVYSVAARVTTFISMLWLATSYPLMPAVARMHARGDLRSLQRMLTNSARVILVVSVLLALALGVFARQFLSLFGGDFHQGIWALRILAIGELSNALSGFAGLALVMSGNESRLTAGTAVGAGINVVLSAALIPVFGVEGPAIAMACGMVAWNSLFAIMLWRRTGLYAPGFGPRRLRFAAREQQGE